MKNTPKITVLMPVYNVAPYVAEAIESILKQTYTDFELLIINDGSTDATRDEILKFRDGRIRFVENERNIGLANTLNKGIDLAQGEYIARMDGDDISLPHRLEKQAAVLDNHPDIDICGAGYRFFGAKNYDVIYPQEHEAIKAGLLLGCYMIIPMFRKKSINDAELRYEQEFFPAEDYRFWTRCVMHLKMYNIQEVLFNYRMHSTQVSETMTNQPEMTIRVKEIYLRGLLTGLDEQQAHDFVCNLADTIIQTLDDIPVLDNLINSLLKENNEQRAIDPVVFTKILHNFVQGKLRSYIAEIWFENKYSLNKYIKLRFSGYYFRLPMNFRIKLLIKSILNKSHIIVRFT